jgi:hypothetical protein
MLNPNAMKKIYLFSFIFCSYVCSFSQTDCSNAQAHIVYAFNNAKNALEANNITHLKFYANKSLDAFERVQSALETCHCESVENYTFESIEKLSKVPPIEKMAEAQYFVGKAKEYAQKIITALDYCTLSDNSTASVVTDYEITDLEKEQLKLKQQQEALKRQQEAIKQQLSKQKKEELLIEKQQLIIKTNAAISKNIQAYNDVLNACQCHTEIPVNTAKQNTDQLMSKSVDEIRTYYIKSIKDLTSNYMNMLSTCDNED